MSDKNVVVYFDNVNFSYQNGIPVIENASFKVYKGGLVSIIGPNGGGKSTILKLILGIIKPKNGDIRVLNGKPGENKTKIGYMPQYVKFDNKFPISVLDLVLMGIIERRKIGMYSLSEKNLAREALKRVNIDDSVSKRSFASLSGGQLQRVLMARAIISQPELLILDEPTSNIDPAGGERFSSILENLNKDMTIITVSHDLGFVSNLFKEVLCVNRIVMKHPVNDLSVISALSEIYGESVHVVDHSKHCYI